jgi:hypothetical protein
MRFVTSTNSLPAASSMSSNGSSQVTMFLPVPCPAPQVTALGIVSIFDQVLGGLPEAERDDVFNAFIGALQEDPKKYRKGGPMVPSSHAPAGYAMPSLCQPSVAG